MRLRRIAEGHGRRGVRTETEHLEQQLAIVAVDVMVAIEIGTGVVCQPALPPVP